MDTRRPGTIRPRPALHIGSAGPCAGKHSAHRKARRLVDAGPRALLGCHVWWMPLDPVSASLPHDSAVPGPCGVLTGYVS